MIQKKDQEIEVKFHLKNRAAFEQRLIKMNARLLHGRILESNLRFDTPGRELTKEHRVLRLRRDNHVHLTYKGPADPNLPATVRQEIEFEANDFEAAHRFLVALGYEVSVAYEKYRTTYIFKNVEVSLDEMPIGDFCEIEGPDIPAVQAAAEALGLNWEARILESYLGLFNNLRVKYALPAKNLTFAEVQGTEIQLEGIGIKTGD